MSLKLTVMRNPLAPDNANRLHRLGCQINGNRLLFPVNNKRIRLLFSLAVIPSDDEREYILIAPQDVTIDHLALVLDDLLSLELQDVLLNHVNKPDQPEPDNFL